MRRAVGRHCTEPPAPPARPTPHPQQHSEGSRWSPRGKTGQVVVPGVFALACLGRGREDPCCPSSCSLCFSCGRADPCHVVIFTPSHTEESRWPLLYASVGSTPRRPPWDVMCTQLCHGQGPHEAGPGRLCLGNVTLAASAFVAGLALERCTGWPR